MSSNPLINLVMGRRSIREDVPVPLAVLPRRSYRDRMLRNRQDASETEEDVDKCKDESRDSVRAVIGEDAQQMDGADEKSVIPDDAEAMDGIERSTFTTRLRDVKDVVQEPSHPSGEKEKYLTPYAALTAPDATPDAMSPIDPSKVPGMSATQSKFTWGELEQTPPAPDVNAPVPSGGDAAVNAMDVLLGRNRAPKPAANAAEATAMGAIATEEQAMAALGIENPLIAEAAKSKAAAALFANPDPAGDSMMPPPAQADPKKVYEAARRFM